MAASVTIQFADSSGFQKGDLGEDTQDSRALREFSPGAFSRFREEMQNKMLFVDSKGSLGICSEDVEEGDQVVFIHGAESLWLLRPLLGERWRLISGTCLPLDHCWDEWVYSQDNLQQFLGEPDIETEEDSAEFYERINVMSEIDEDFESFRIF
jgi:hypothetical protein